MAPPLLFGNKLTTSSEPSFSSYGCPCGNPNCTINRENEYRRYYYGNYVPVNYPGVVLTEPNNKNKMLDKFLNLFRTEPAKSFRKAGITNDNGLLTSDGKEILLNWLLKTNGDLFKTEIVDELLKKDETK